MIFFSKLINIKYSKNNRKIFVYQNRQSIGNITGNIAVILPFGLIG